MHQRCGCAVLTFTTLAGSSLEYRWSHFPSLLRLLGSPYFPLTCTLGAWQQRPPVVSPNLGLSRRRSCRLNVEFIFYFILFFLLQHFSRLAGCSSPCKRRLVGFSFGFIFSVSKTKQRQRLEITRSSCGRAPSDNNTRGFEEKSYCLCCTCCFDRPQIHRPSASRPPGSRRWAAAQIR